MSEPEKILRHEINEDRANRDAFKLALVIGTLFALFLVALILAAWNTRIAFLPLAPKTPPPPIEKAFLHSALGIRHSAFSSRHLAAARPKAGHVETTTAAGVVAGRGANFCGLAPAGPVSPAHARSRRCRATAGLARHSSAGTTAAIFHPTKKLDAATRARNRSTMAVSVDLPSAFSAASAFQA